MGIGFDGICMASLGRPSAPSGSSGIALAGPYSFGASATARGSGFRVQGSGFRVQGSGLMDQGSGLGAQGSGFRGLARAPLREGRREGRMAGHEVKGRGGTGWVRAARGPATPSICLGGAHLVLPSPVPSNHPTRATLNMIPKP